MTLPPRKDPIDAILNLITRKGYADTHCPRCNKPYVDGNFSCVEKSCAKIKYLRKRVK